MTKRPIKPPPPVDPRWESRRKITIKEAAAINGVSVATFRKYHGDLIKKLSPRRSGVELADALAIGSAKSERAA